MCASSPLQDPRPDATCAQLLSFHNKIAVLRVHVDVSLRDKASVAVCMEHLKGEVRK